MFLSDPDLSAELYSLISVHLDIPSALNCIRVSHSWNKAFLPIVYKHVFINLDPDLNPAQYPRRPSPESFAKHAHLVRSLTVALYTSFSFPSVPTLQIFCPNLSTLWIISHFDHGPDSEEEVLIAEGEEDDEEMQEIRLKEEQQMKLLDRSMTDFLQRHHSTIQDLKLDLPLTSGLVRALAKCTRLRRFRHDHFVIECTPAQFVDQFLPIFGQLEGEVVLRGPWFGTKRPKPRWGNVHDPVEIPPVVAEKLKSMASNDKIRELDLQNNFLYGPHQLILLDMIGLCSGLTRLSWSVQQCRYDDYEDAETTPIRVLALGRLVDRVSSVYRKLESVTVPGTTFDLDVFKALLKSLPSVTKLDLADSPAFGWDACKFLTRDIPRLYSDKENRPWVCLGLRELTMAFICNQKGDFQYEEYYSDDGYNGAEASDCDSEDDLTFDQIMVKRARESLLDSDFDDSDDEYRTFDQILAARAKPSILMRENKFKIERMAAKRNRAKTRKSPQSMFMERLAKLKQLKTLDMTGSSVRDDGPPFLSLSSSMGLNQLKTLKRLSFLSGPEEVSRGFEWSVTEAKWVHPVDATFTLTMDSPNPLLIPVIHSLICGYLDKRSILNCILVSQAFHKAFLPKIWSNVKLNFDIKNSSYYKKGPTDHPDAFRKNASLIQKLEIRVSKSLDFPSGQLINCSNLSSLTVSSSVIKEGDCSPWEDYSDDDGDNNDNNKDADEEENKAKDEYEQSLISFLKRHKDTLQELDLDAPVTNKLLTVLNTCTRVVRFSHNRFAIECTPAQFADRFLPFFAQLEGTVRLHGLWFDTKKLTKATKSRKKGPIRISPKVADAIEAMKPNKMIRELDLKTDFLNSQHLFVPLDLIGLCPELVRLTWLVESDRYKEYRDTDTPIKMLFLGGYLKRLPDFKKLVSVEVPSTSFEPEEFKGFLEALPAMTKLDLSCNSGFDRTCCRILTQQVPRYRTTLTDLDLRYCRQADPKVVHELMCTMSALEVLVVDYITASTLYKDKRNRPWVCLGMRELTLAFICNDEHDPMYESFCFSSDDDDDNFDDKDERGLGLGRGRELGGGKTRGMDGLSFDQFGGLENFMRMVMSSGKDLEAEPNPDDDSYAARFTRMANAERAAMHKITRPGPSRTEKSTLGSDIGSDDEYDEVETPEAMFISRLATFTKLESLDMGFSEVDRGPPFLELSLDHGLDQMKNLKNLRQVIGPHDPSTDFCWSEAEAKWAIEHWESLEKLGGIDVSAKAKKLLTEEGIVVDRF
ncbi:hypothetical protein BGZ83_007692 [Gryganskiella cystojenkinii]|nr:hypothetical protein BGZ83_007692 [Gryganskiella cystojenkinii]